MAFSEENSYQDFKESAKIALSHSVSVFPLCNLIFYFISYTVFYIGKSISFCFFLRLTS